MARGRRRGRGGGGGGGGNPGELFETIFDTLLVASMSGLQSRSPHFIFNGTPSALITRIYSLSPEQISKITDLTITIFGNQVQGVNTCCYTTTVCLGALFICPLCLLCCGAWQSYTYPQYTINKQVYEALVNMVRSSSARNFNLSVYDNALDAQKFEILYQMVSQRNLKILMVTNNAMQHNYKNDENSNFKENGKKLFDYCTSVGTGCQITWGTQTL